MNIVEKETTMKWYVLRSQTNREKSLSEKLIKEGEVGDLMGKLGRVIVPIENSFYLKNGKVKIKAKICNKVIQAITYAGLESIVAGGEVTGIDCIPDSAESVEDRVIPLGAQVRVNRILTITFIDNQDGEVVISNVEGIDLDASPANSGMFAIGDN